MHADEIWQDGHQPRADVLDEHVLVEEDVEGEHLEEDVGADKKVVGVRRRLLRRVDVRAVVELEQHDDVDHVEALLLLQDLYLDGRIVVDLTYGSYA